MPYYDIEDLIAACNALPATVLVARGAQITAGTDFGLHSVHEIIDFIGNGGLENLRHKNSRPWENYNGSGTPPLVDAWLFNTNNISGYLAFLKNKQNWIIKSFKKDDSQIYASQRHIASLT